MAALEGQLFRFTVLRGAEPGSPSSPIVIAEPSTPENDQLRDLGKRVAAWLAEADLSVATGQDLRGALGLDGELDSSLVEGAKTLEVTKLRGMLADAIQRPDEFDRSSLAESCDFLTAATLLGELPTISQNLSLAEWIQTHPIVVEDLSPIIQGPTWFPHQALVRSPGLVDHYVVRDTLLGYEMGEIEDIKNYLKGEKKEHTLRYLKVNEEESVTETEEESNRTNETATQQRNSMSQATQETANSTMGFDARVKTDGQYGPTKISSDVGFQYSSTTNDARQVASEFSTEVVSRSVEQVRKRELRRVTRRARVEIEENQGHVVDNTQGPKHNVGIYRWVESVWKATTYKLIEPRLVLELMIPEPGRAVLPPDASSTPTDLPPRPEELDPNLFDNLTDKEAARLATAYGAEGIKARPLERQVIGLPFGTTEFKDAPPDHIAAILVKEVKVPDDYVGEAVVVAVTGMSQIGPNVQSNIVIDVPGAHHTTFLDIPGGPSNPFLIEGGVGVTARPNKDLRTLHLSAKGNFGPGATIPVSIYSEDLRGFTGFVEVHCHVSDKAVAQWKLDTIQALSSAYRARLAEWESLKLSRSFEAEATLPDPDLDALCRHACISSMLGKWPPADNLSDGDGWPKPGALAGAQGELILFMEQAFEWHNLQYVLYPYYWADGTRWKRLLAADHPDPRVREFLRCGAARIVISVPPSMIEAVLFFLGTGLPWFGNGAPIPKKPGYVPIADEIRLKRKQNGEDEEVVDEYRYTLPTSLIILQESGELPEPAP